MMCIKDRHVALEAAKLLVAECEQLEPGNSTMQNIANMFIGCENRAIAASDVRMSTNKRVAFSSALDEERHAYMFTEEQKAKFKKNIKSWCAIEYEELPPNKAAILMLERGTTTLRIIDPYEDEGVWCIATPTEIIG